MVKPAGRTAESLAKFLKQLPDGLDSDPLSVSLLAMADLVDDPDTSAHARSLCQGRLADGVKELRALMPPKEKKDAVDELGDRRARRRAGGATT